MILSGYVISLDGLVLLKIRLLILLRLLPFGLQDEVCAIVALPLLMDGKILL